MPWPPFLTQRMPWQGQPDSSGTAAPPDPGSQDALRQLMGLSAAPEQEQWLLRRLKIGQAMRFAEPHRITSGAGGAAAWGLADAVKNILGGREEGVAEKGLQDLSAQRVSGRQKFFDLMQPDRGLGPEGNSVVAPEAVQADGLRRRSLATSAALTGDPVLEKAGETFLKQQQLDREYAVLAAQVEHQHRQEQLEERKQGATETQQAWEREHQGRMEADWQTTPLPEQGGFMNTSRHTGESWFYRPGEPPVLVVPGKRPGGGAAPAQPQVAPQPDPSQQPPAAPPAGPQSPGGAPGGSASAPVPPAPAAAPFKPYVKLGSEQAQAAVRGQAGATGLVDALSAGFPTTSKLRSIPETMSWKAAENGFPQLASPDDQARVAAWDAVFDPVARMRAGLRIPEEQMSRMRMELRPQPGESWDNHVSKTKRILETFRAEAETLPPVKSKPILEELDRAEAMLPRTKEEYEAFNKNAVSAMQAHRAGKDAPQSVSVAPRATPAPGAALRKPAKASLQERLRTYYGGQ